MSAIWVNDKRIREWILPRRSVDEDSDDGVHVMARGHFQKRYNQVQGMIQKIGCMDDLLSGKSMFYCTITGSCTLLSNCEIEYCLLAHKISLFHTKWQIYICQLAKT